tara:strand:- start:37 stop:174 length:138 start_codon:yes stop_codon:yes gene_type:complete
LDDDDDERGSGVWRAIVGIAVITEPGSFAIRLGLVWLERDATVTD